MNNSFETYDQGLKRLTDELNLAVSKAEKANADLAEYFEKTKSSDNFPGWTYADIVDTLGMHFERCSECEKNVRKANLALDGFISRYSASYDETHQEMTAEVIASMYMQAGEIPGKFITANIPPVIFDSLAFALEDLNKENKNFFVVKFCKEDQKVLDKLTKNISISDVKKRLVSKILATKIACAMYDKKPDAVITSTITAARIEDCKQLLEKADLDCIKENFYRLISFKEVLQLGQGHLDLAIVERGLDHDTLKELNVIFGGEFNVKMYCGDHKYGAFIDANGKYLQEGKDFILVKDMFLGKEEESERG